MILVRDVFRLKFGKTRDALVAFKKIGELARKQGGDGVQSQRVLTDLVGTYYTIVFEATHTDLGSYERDSLKAMSDPDWKKAYSEFVPLVESGHREIFSIHELK